MKHITLNLLLLANSIMLISYMGLTINSNIEVNATETVPLFLSSLMLIDITYISSCNVRENKVISLFCSLLALHSWYILLSASDNSMAHMAFSALSPVIWYVSIKFILMFLFQGSGYRFQKAVSTCLSGTCICSLIGLLVSDKIFALFYGIQFLIGWLCFLFLAVFHRKRTAFVFKAEWKCILFSLVTVSILFLAYWAPFQFRVISSCPAVLAEYPRHHTQRTQQPPAVNRIQQMAVSLAPALRGCRLRSGRTGFGRLPSTVFPHAGCPVCLCIRLQYCIGL